MTDDQDKPANYPQGMWYTFLTATTTSMYTPTPYGVLVSFTYGNECAQLWFAQAYGVIYHRQGNASGWSGPDTKYASTHGWHVLDGTY